MTNDTNKICPECNGEKKISGTCVCDMEWRGSTDYEICPACRGTGYVSG
jgi:hypothetical protein